MNALNNGWAGIIYPYVKSTGVYICPDDPTVRNHISYAENQRVAGQSLAALSYPVSTVALYEFTTTNCNPSTPERVSATGLTAPQDSTRHDPATFALNYLAADGHVKRLTPGQVSSGLNPAKPKLYMIGGYLMTFAVK